MGRIEDISGRLSLDLQASDRVASSHGRGEEVLEFGPAKKHNDCLALAPRLTRTGRPARPPWRFFKVELNELRQRWKTR